MIPPIWVYEITSVHKFRFKMHFKHIIYHLKIANIKLCIIMYNIIRYYLNTYFIFKIMILYYLGTYKLGIWYTPNINFKMYNAYVHTQRAFYVLPWSMSIYNHRLKNLKITFYSSTSQIHSCKKKIKNIILTIHSTFKYNTYV